jgi:hypothetical protein
MKAHPSSFRDLQGFMFEQDGVLYRQVNESGRAGYEGLMGSGLYDELAAKQLLVPFISYRYERSFSQLKKPR